MIKVILAVLLLDDHVVALSILSGKITAVDGSITNEQNRCVSEVVMITKS